MLKPSGMMCKDVYNLTFKCSTQKRMKEGREGGRAKCKQAPNPGIRYTGTHCTGFQLFDVFNFFLQIKIWRKILVHYFGWL